MTWFRVDDGFQQHPKVLRIPRSQRAGCCGLWALAGAWCARNLTDGLLDDAMVEELAGTEAQAAELVRVGLWERTDGGYAFHDWASQQPTRAEVEAKRQAEAERKARWREQRRGTTESVPAPVPAGHDTGQTGDETRDEGRSPEEVTPGVRTPRPDPTRPDPYLLTSGGNDALVDAGERDTPPDTDGTDGGTPPAPASEEWDVVAAADAYEAAVAAKRAEADAPVHENAMPPDRCPVHRDHPAGWVEEKCARCQQAKAAQRAWIEERDRKVAEARAQAEAEIVAARRAEQAAIDACSRCSPRGVLPSGVKCSHDPEEPDEDLPSGRAQFRAELAKLRGRSAAKATSTVAVPPGADGGQLQQIAILLGEFGVTSREKRLELVGELVGHSVKSTRELTHAEAEVVIDRLRDARTAERTGDAEVVEEAAAADHVEPEAASTSGTAAEASEPLSPAPPEDPLAPNPAAEPEPEDDDGTEPEPEGDDAAEEEFLRDRQTWRDEEDRLERTPYALTGGHDDEPPF